MPKAMYGHKGHSGAYGSKKSGAKAVRNPLKGKRMARGPKEVKASQKGYVA